VSADEIIDLGTVTLRGSYLENDRKLHDLIRLNDARCAVLAGVTEFDITGRAVPHATEADVDRALNCEQDDLCDSCKYGFVRTKFYMECPQCKADRAKWELAYGANCEQGPERHHPSVPGFTPSVNYPDLDSDVGGVLMSDFPTTITIEVSYEVVMEVMDIWPDGDEPEVIDGAAVKAEMEAAGRCESVLRDWDLCHSPEVIVTVAYFDEQNKMTMTVARPWDPFAEQKGAA
jgi:hypothetical protein